MPRLVPLLSVLLLGCASRTGPSPTPISAPDLAPEAISPLASVPLERFQDLLFIDVTDPTGTAHLFVLDTGASFTVIDPTVAAAFEPVPYIDENGESFDVVAQTSGPGSIDLGSMVVLPRVGLGELTLVESVGVFVVDISVAARVLGRPIAGVLGFQSLQMPHTIDYGTNTLHLYETLPPQEGPGLVLQDAYYTPIVELELGGEPVPVILDTGSGACLSLPLDVAMRAGLAGEPVPTGYSQTMSGVVEDRSARLSGSLAIPPHAIPRPIVDIAHSPNAHVGGMLLEHFALHLDPANDRVWFTRTGDADATCASLTTLGFSYAQGDAGWEVVLILPGFLESGIQAGDVLVSIAGTPVAELDRPAVEALLAQPDGNGRGQ